MKSKMKKVSSFSLILLSFALVAAQSQAASNSQTGYDSSNSADKFSEQFREISNTNFEEVENNLKGRSVTGENTGNFNSDASKLVTGEAFIGGMLANMFNFNDVQDVDNLKSDLSACNETTGAESCNHATSYLENEIDITNKNAIDAENNLHADAVSGSNCADYSNCGAEIDTGDAGVMAVLMNEANENYVKAGSADNNPSLSASNSKTGYDSHNDAASKLINKVNIDSENCADIENNLKLIADTGNNNANYNGGVSKIKTGMADVESLLKNTDINKNYTEANIASGNIDLCATNEKTGANSDNDASAEMINCVDISSNNSADIENNITSKALTGDNRASFNSGGITSIETGDAESDVEVENSDINTNITKVNIGSGSMDVCASNSTTGACSDNDAKALLINKVDVSNVNTADIENNIKSIADTGGNKSSYNSGGAGHGCDCDCDDCDDAGNCEADSGPCDCDSDCGCADCGGSGCDCNTCDDANGSVNDITTGDASSNVVVKNEVNTNVTTIDVSKDICVSAENCKTGAESNNEAEALVKNEISVTNINEANIENNITSISNTGGNSSNYNTGGDPITTGSSKVMMLVDNSGNSNVVK